METSDTLKNPEKSGHTHTTQEAGTLISTRTIPADGYRSVATFDRSLIRINQTLRVCLTTPRQSIFFWVLFASVCQDAPPQQLTAWPHWEIRVKCLSQGHNDALPGGELKRESVTLLSHRSSY